MFSKFFIYHPVFSAVLSIVIVLFGLVALVALPVDRYPEISPPTVVVEATYPGATAETIAETVATPIEQEVNGVEGMIYMTSTSSSDGTMQLKVTFETGVDLDMSNVLVQNRVTVAEPKLPEEVRRLGIKVKKRSSQMTMLVNLYAEDDRYDEVFLNNYASARIRDELTRVRGVGEVTIFGVEYAMRIWLDPEKMSVRGLTTTDVIGAIRSQNVEVAAGQIGEPPIPEGQAFQFTVNTQGRLSDPMEFADIIIRTGEGGRMIRVKDVARVEPGAKTYNLSSHLNGGPTATMMVYQLPGSNAIEVADGVTDTLERLSADFPAGMKYRASYDATDVIRASIKEVVITLFMTLGLVVLTVYVFLQNFRATIIPALTIPVSLIGTFIVMSALGYSLNVLTLFGLVLVIGIVVDDAIVVVENTSRLIDEGMKPKEAAVQSMVEVTGPVIATTLVLLAVFVPTMFLGGITGALFQQFAVTISIATVFSSVNALTLSPALCGILLRPRPSRQAWPFRLFNRSLELTTVAYTGSVRWALRGAVFGIVVFVGIVCLAGYGFGQLPTGFVPQEDEGYFLVTTQLPDAASMERSQAVMNKIDELLLNNAKGLGIVNVVSITGLNMIDESRSSNAGTTYVVLDHWDERQEDALKLQAVVDRVNAMFRDQIEEAFVIAFAPPSLPGLGASGGFSLQVQDRSGLGVGVLQQVSAEMVANANTQTSLSSAFSTFSATVPQLYLDIDREQVQSMDIPVQDVFDTLAAALGSAYINDFVHFGRIYQVKAQAEPAFRTKPDDIGRLEVRNRSGGMTPLASLIRIDETLGPQTITHFNIYPAARINGAPAEGFSSGQAMAVVEGMADQDLPQGMGFGWTDLSYQEAAATGSAAVTFLFSIIMVYLVLAAQYESWSVPWGVVLSVPAALLGAVAGTILRQFDSNVYTQIGVVLLIGLSAKTAILIVEFAKSQHEAGESIFEAALSASRLRFRAVLMTAFSFVLGVIPLLVASGAGAASRQVLGTTVFFGMMFGTVVGVVAVPMLYFAIQTFTEKVNRTKPSTTES